MKKILLSIFIILAVPLLLYSKKIKTKEELKEFAEGRITTMDESLKVPYYNFSLNSREFAFNTRLKAGPFYLEPRALYYPASDEGVSLVRPGTMSYQVPYCAGGEFGLILKEVPDIFGRRSRTLGSGRDDDGGGLFGFLLGAVIDTAVTAEAMYWYHDLYIYVGQYHSDKVLRDNAYVEEPTVINKVGIKRMNFQKIRKVEFDDEKYYTTPGESRTYDGSYIEYWKMDKDFRFIWFAEGKIYREWELNWGLFHRVEVAKYNTGTENEKMESRLEMGISFISERFWRRLVLRLGVGFYSSINTYDYAPLVRPEQEIFPVLDFQLMI